MNFDSLTQTIQLTHSSLQKKALSAVNQSLTIRNWLIGYYIVEFEQKGEDRAEYGEKLIPKLALELKKRNIKGLSKRNLSYSKDFYLIYPQVVEYLNRENHIRILQSLTAKFQLPDIQAVIINPLTPPVDQLLRTFTFTHFVELIRIKDPAKRAFYEWEGIKGAWSVRQLKRQMESLLYERTGMSQDKKGLLEMENQRDTVLNIADAIRDPYILEFTGLMEKGFYSENDLETALLDHVQDFLLELGNGFCFESRQRRITMDNEHDRVDLVFYHRILKCHVLIDLKVRKFTHADAGQMNFYLNYFRHHLMVEGDNPPVGIVLCTDKHETKVQYATAGMDSKVFVSKYLINLPSEAELQAFVEENRERIESSGDRLGTVEEPQAHYGKRYAYRTKYRLGKTRPYQSIL